MSEGSDLDTLFPGVDVPVTLRGKGLEMIRVEPWYATQFALAIAKVRPLAKAVGSVAVIDGNTVSMKVGADFGEFLERIVDAADDGVNAVIDLLCISLKKPRPWFDDVPLDGLFDLAEAMYKQNQSFFVRRVLPMLPGQVRRQAAAGPQSSQSSSQPDTAEATLTE